MKKKSSKKKKRKLSIYKIVGLLLIIMSIILFSMINMLDVLPAKYYYLVIVIFLVVDLPIEFFLFRNKAKKYKRNTSLCFAIIFIIAMILPIIYLGKTLGFVWNIKDSDYKLENYSVVVLKKSNYKKMIDIKGLPVGIYENTCVRCWTETYWRSYLR